MDVDTNTPRNGLHFWLHNYFLLPFFGRLNIAYSGHVSIDVRPVELTLLFFFNWGWGWLGNDKLVPYDLTAHQPRIAGLKVASKILVEKMGTCTTTVSFLSIVTTAGCKSTMDEYAR
jgi:hypothetical protein